MHRCRVLGDAYEHLHRSYSALFVDDLLALGIEEVKRQRLGPADGLSLAFVPPLPACPLQVPTLTVIAGRVASDERSELLT